MLQRPDFTQQEEAYWSQGIKYGQQEIRRIINGHVPLSKRILSKSIPLLNAATYRPEEKAVAGTFSIPRRKRKKYTAVTEIHYHRSCNELTMLLWGLMSQDRDPAISNYITPEEFGLARDGYRFHIYHDNLKFRRYHTRNEQWHIALRFLRAKPTNGKLYVHFEVSGTVAGERHYLYQK